MHSANFIPVDFSPRQDILTDPTGSPVWPVRTESERIALEKITTVFAANMRTVTGALAESSAAGGLVVHLSAECRSDAQLYAHLTSRRCAAIANLDDVKETPSVVITTPDGLTNGLLSRLYSHAVTDEVPGIVCAHVADLRSQVLVRAAAAHLLTAMTTRCVEVFPLHPPDRVVVDSREIAPEDVDRLHILNIIGSGAGVLAIQTHSDGQDAMLPAQLTLCSMDKVPHDADERLSNRCVQTDQCHRSRHSVTDFIASSRFVSPNDFRARILIWDVCWGAIPPTGIVHPAWGLGQRLLDNPSLGAVVAPWDLSIASMQLMEPLLDHIRNGWTVGSAVAHHNASRAARNLGHRMCVLGDPRVRIPASPTPRPPHPVCQLQAPRTRIPAQRGSAGFLELLLECMTTNEPITSQTLGATGVAAKEKLLRYCEFVAGGLPVEGGPDASGPLLRSAIISCMRKRGPMILHEWMEQAIMLSAGTQAVPCPCCQDQQNLLNVSIMIIPQIAVTRCVKRCQRCGVIEDVPAENRVSFLVDRNGFVRLDGPLPTNCWTAALMVRLQHTKRRLFRRWPARADGTPVRVMRLKTISQQGILQVGVTLLHKTDLYAFSQLIHQP